MFQLLKNTKGQGHAVQYTTTFFLIVAVIMGMSVYVRRSVQAKIRDTNYYMLNEVAKVTEANVLLQYEPYYISSQAIRTVDAQQIDRTGASLPAPSGIYERTLSETIQTQSVMDQLPARNAL